jgi:two-component system CheB/CheR fusion protein
MPIDFFFRSLAEDQESRAIGVVLSGSASDGTLGLQAIKAHGGVTFAQDEATAKYSAMPRSAVAAGSVDFVLPPELIARELKRIAAVFISLRLRIRLQPVKLGPHPPTKH